MTTHLSEWLKQETVTSNAGKSVGALVTHTLLIRLQSLIATVKNKILKTHITWKVYSLGNNDFYFYWDCSI